MDVRKLMLYDLVQDKVVRELEHQAFIISLCIAQDQQTLVTGQRRNFKVWRFGDLHVEREIQQNASSDISQLLYSPDQQYLATLSYECCVVYEARDFIIHFKVEIDCFCYLFQLAFSPNSRVFALFEDKKSTLYDMEKSEVLDVFNEHEKLSRAYMPQFFDNNTFYFVQVVDNVNTVQSRLVDSGAQTRVLDCGPSGIRQQLLSTNSKYLVQSLDNEVLIYVNVHLQTSDETVIQAEITNDIFNHPEKYRRAPPSKSAEHNPLNDLILQLQHSNQQLFESAPFLKKEEKKEERSYELRFENKFGNLSAEPKASSHHQISANAHYPAQANGRSFKKFEQFEGKYEKKYENKYDNKYENNKYDKYDKYEKYEKYDNNKYDKYENNKYDKYDH